MPDNFRFPYAAVGFSDFWRRWHITLSRFLRDYLYIPLGGNRHGPIRRYVNLGIVMLLGGFWHGANWTFVVWGGAHGLMLGVNHAWRALACSRSPALKRPWVGATAVAFVIAGMFLLSVLRLSHVSPFLYYQF
jgi:D-alanyl-lipoteichoic acid acyltransferase DltB (MBOAT superfamily)